MFSEVISPEGSTSCFSRGVAASFDFSDIGEAGEQHLTKALSSSHGDASPPDDDVMSKASVLHEDVELWTGLEALFFGITRSSFYGLRGTCASTQSLRNRECAQD